MQLSKDEKALLGRMAKKAAAQKVEQESLQILHR